MAKTESHLFELPFANIEEIVYIPNHFDSDSITKYLSKTTICIRFHLAIPELSSTKKLSWVINYNTQHHKTHPITQAFWHWKTAIEKEKTWLKITWKIIKPKTCSSYHQPSRNLTCWNLNETGTCILPKQYWICQKTQHFLLERSAVRVHQLRHDTSS